MLSLLLRERDRKVRKEAGERTEEVKMSVQTHPSQTKRTRAAGQRCKQTCPQDIGKTPRGRGSSLKQLSPQSSSSEGITVHQGGVTVLVSLEEVAVCPGVSLTR